MQKELNLNTGAKIPSVGFGTWQIFPNGRAKKAVASALEIGYRHIDTARAYGNEKGVGEAISESKISRKDIFVTTKLWSQSLGYDNAQRAIDNSLKRLKMEYVDLYLIHFPRNEKRLESWRAFEEIYTSGKAKSVGVSNFTVRHLQELMDKFRVVPAINQVEFHPFLYKDQIELLKFCKKHKIVIEAYSPLAHGKKTDDLVLPPIAKKHGKSVSQIILRWCLQHGTLPLPKSTNPEHMKENLDIYDFELSESEMDSINELSDGTRTCWDPTDVK